MTARINSIIRSNLKRRRLIIAAVIITPLLVYVLFSSRGVVTRFTLTFDKQHLQADIDRAKKIRDSLNLRIESLESDDKLIERIAREQYGMIKPGETVFVTEE